MKLVIVGDCTVVEDRTEGGSCSMICIQIKLTQTVIMPDFKLKPHFDMETILP